MMKISIDGFISKIIIFISLGFLLSSCSFFKADFSSNSDSDSTLPVSPPTPSFSVALSTSAPDYVMNSFVVTATFSEEVSGLQAGDFEITGGAISYFTGSGTAYAFTVTPTADVSVKLPSNVIQGSSGLKNPESNILVRKFDNTTVTLGWSKETSIKAEGNSVMADFIPVTLSSTKPYDVVLKYSVIAQGTTAINPTHFDLPSSGTITIPAGSTTAQLNYNFIGDSTFTASKVFKVAIESTNSHAVLLGLSTHQHILLEDDGGNAFTQVSTGEMHSCAVTSTGVLKCWGNNGNGQLGDGTTTTRNTATVIDSGITYQSVSAGYAHTCAITTAGALKCWGNNGSGQLGIGNTSNQTSPAVVDLGTIYTQVSVGHDHTCAITSTGVLKCWGQSAQGRLGNGVTAFGSVTNPLVIDSGVSYLNIAAGFENTCGITSAHDLKCWGSNGSGQIGDGTTNASSLPKIVDSGVSYSQIELGTAHSCGVTGTGVLKCWGSNSNGQLGDNSTTDRWSPTVIDSGTAYLEVGLGHLNSCAITTAGVLKCWGSNWKGQLGDGTTTDRSLPTVISSGTVFSKVAASPLHACAISSRANLQCWGDSRYIGIFPTLQQYSPVSPPSGSYLQIIAGDYHTCALDSSGALSCWGDNSKGQLGDGSAKNRSAPVRIDVGTPYLMISTGYEVTCGITLGYALKCWGYGGDGALGTGTTTDAYLPTLIDPGTTYAQVSAGSGSHTCAITTAGVLKCWGANWYGQLGDGTTTDSLDPLIVNAGTTYKKVSTGGGQTCAITDSGELHCWGSSWNGEVGTGVSSTNYSTPQVIDSGTTYSSVEAGGNHTCGITTAGVLKCWGNNLNGELGNGAYVSQSAPVVVESGTSFARVSLNWNTSYGITTDGTLKCWGVRCVESSFSSTPPVVMDSGVSYSEIGTGSQHACAIVASDHSLKCWGNDLHSQLGIGTVSPALAPVTTDY